MIRSLSESERHFDCSGCGQTAGSPCRNKHGRITSEPHQSRQRALRDWPSGPKFSDPGAMNWDDPCERARLIERVGADEYNRLFQAHRRDSVVAQVAGYAIRPIGTRFGRLFQIDNGDAVAFATLAEAEAWCQANPRSP